MGLKLGNFAEIIKINCEGTSGRGWPTERSTGKAQVPRKKRDGAQGCSPALLPRQQPDKSALQRGRCEPGFTGML